MGQNSKLKISLTAAIFLVCSMITSVQAQEKKNIRLVLVSLSWNIRAGLVDKKMTVERVINDRILKQAQDELRREGRLSR